MKKRALAAALAIATCAPSAYAGAVLCHTTGVRISLVDAGSTSMVEISARVTKSLGGKEIDVCRLDWSRIVLSSSDPSGPSPNVAIVETFVEHARTPPMLLASGLSSAALRDMIVEPVDDAGKIVALRMIVEDTDGGLKLDMPTGLFPPPSEGARIERRVKSARDSTGKFGPIGEIELPPSPPGPAGGLGPTGPFDVDRIVVECAPSGSPPSMPLPAWATVLDGFRATLPLRALDLSAANEPGWDDLARHAWAAALHGDPVVAELGVSSLAWLAGGLDVQANKLDASVAPKSVVESIGDVRARLEKRYGAVGELLVLGRPSTFRRVLRASPAADPERVKAAKASVARLASLSPADVAAFVTPAMIEATAPVDPPVAAEPTLVAPPSASTTPQTTIPRKYKAIHRRWRKLSPRALTLAVLGVVTLVALVVLALRRRRAAV